jgi:tetratricopeptide (TPR) repeat protein
LLHDAGRSGEAREQAERAVALAPLLPEAHLVMAQVQFELGEFEAALGAADRVIQLAPNRTAGYVERSRLAARAKDWRSTETWARRALALDPGDEAALNNLGVALQGQGREAEALDLFARAAAANPRSDIAARNARSLASRIGMFSVAGGMVGAAVVGVNIAFNTSPPLGIGMVAGLLVAVVAAKAIGRRRALTAFPDLSALLGPRRDVVRWGLVALVVALIAVGVVLARYASDGEPHAGTPSTITFPPEFTATTPSSTG